MTLDISDFSEQVVKPAMSAIAEAVDGDILAVGIQNAGNKVAITGTPVIKNLANIGKAYTMNTYMSQNVPSSSSETAGTVTALKVTGTKKEKQFTASSVTPTTGKFAVGDIIIVNGYIYTVAEAVTASSGSATVKIDEEIVETISTAVDAMPIIKEHLLGFHRNGLALVTRELELPAGATKAAIASANSLAVRVVYGYDQDTKTDKISFDIIYGVKDLNDDLLVDFA